MEKFLVVKRLSIFNIFIVMLYKFFKFEVYIFEFSETIANWHLLELLSLKRCNFEECIDIDLDRYGGNIGNAVDNIVDEYEDAEVFESLNCFFTNIKYLNAKNKLFFRDYVIDRCTKLNNICIWIDGYFVNHKKNDFRFYLLGDISLVEKKFLLIQFSDLNVKPIFSSNLFVVFGMIQKIFVVLFRKIFIIFNSVIRPKYATNNVKKISFIKNNIDASNYKVLYFPHQSIFYGDLYVKDNFYSKDINSTFYPANILHIEFEDLTITESQFKFYKENNITTVLLPKPGIKNLYSSIIKILGALGTKKMLRLLSKDFVIFINILSNTAKFISTKELIQENYKAKLVLVGYDILFPTILSLAFESLRIRTVAIQERFLPTFFSNYSLLIDTYLSNSELVCKIVENANNKFTNSCIPCGQIRSDILVNYQKNSTPKNKTFTIVAFDLLSHCDANVNRLDVFVNWKANASFYEDLCNLAERFTEANIIIRGKNTDWIKIPFFKDVVNRINRISNIWVNDDYSKINMQYKLASMSDLVIAKPSSIGDEIIAAGKRVIYHDYIPNSSRYFASHYFNYNNFNIFAYSYIQLEKMVKKVLNGGELLTEKELTDLQLITNNAKVDGKVNDRVMENLNIIYNQVN